jgi:MiaB-like protein
LIDNSTFGTLKALFHTFGCKLNFAETSTVARMFAEEGITRVGPGDTPDVIVINTCSVTELADKKCRQAIRSFHRRYPEAAILVTGCYAQLKPSEVASLPGVAVVAGNDRKNRLPEFLHEFVNSRKPASDVVPTPKLLAFNPSCSQDDRTRHFLKIQDGCDYYCTYCTIPAARGRSRSGTIASIVAQAEKAAANGAKEIVITGVNIGDFGRRTADESGLIAIDGPRETFLDLIRRLDTIEGIERYRISSIEPNLLTDEIIEFCASSRRFMPHFHIPLQSGSDEVLRLMHRHYDTALFRHKIERIRQLIPHAFIGVDLIAGARGETEEEFIRSRDFVESLPITRLHIFPYSERPGTKALEIGHVVSQQDKHRRVNELLHVSERKMEAFARQFLGTVRPVLLERGRPGEPMSGFTDNYLKVSVDAPHNLDNTIVPVRLLSLIPTEIGDCHIKAELAGTEPTQK